MPFDRISMCSNTLYVSNIDGGSSLGGCLNPNMSPNFRRLLGDDLSGFVRVRIPID